jgi:hypothetical protein
VFRQRHRRSPFADFIPWNDYRVAGAPRPFCQSPFGGGWGSRRRSRLGQMLIGLAIIVAVVYVIQRLVSPRNRSAWF